MTKDFYYTCALQLPQVTAAYARSSLKCAETILEDREAAEVFFYATEGLHRDLPSTRILKKRLTVLAHRFGHE